MHVLLHTCIKAMKTVPVPAVVPPVAASPPSSSWVFGSPAVCVCGRCVLSDILLHKFQSAETKKKINMAKGQCYRDILGLHWVAQFILLLKTEH